MRSHVTRFILVAVIAGSSWLSPHRAAEAQLDAEDCPASVVFASRGPDAVRETQIGFSDSGPANADPGRIIAGPDGALWFTEQSQGRIGRITTYGSYEFFRIPGEPKANARDLTSGPDGAIWFTDSSSNTIGRLDGDGEVQAFPIPTPQSGPQGIVLGPDGALWFTESRANQIGRMARGGTVVEFPLISPDSGPSDIVVGADQAIWFSQPRARKIGRITIDGVVSELDVGTAPTSIASGPDGALWFVAPNASGIGRLNSEGAVRVFPMDSPYGAPNEIAVGPDGALWYTTLGPGRLHRMALDGTSTTFLWSPKQTPMSLVAGPDRALWFTETYNWIGRLQVVQAADGQSLVSQPIEAQCRFRGTWQGQADVRWAFEHDRATLATSGPPRLGLGDTEITSPNGHSMWFRGYTITGPHPSAVGMAVGSDGAVWFTKPVTAGHVGRLSPDLEFSEFPLWPDARIMNLTLGPDGALWTVDELRGHIGRIGPDGTATIVVEGTCGQACRKSVFTWAPDGAFWFSQVGGMGRMAPSGEITSFPLPGSGVSGSFIYGNPIAAGPDGALWFLQYIDQQSVATRMELNGSFTSFPLPEANFRVVSLAFGADGALWLSGSIPTGPRSSGSLPQIVRMTRDGAFTEFVGTDGGSSIALGPDGALWLSGGGLTRITASGERTTFQFPSCTGRTSHLAWAPDGTLWVTIWHCADFGPDAIGQVQINWPMARDGASLFDQSPDIRVSFRSVWGSSAPQRWVEEHDSALARSAGT
jgi:virginiamycin B lyase